MSFKLLAIRPLNGCNPKFLKNLKENQLYQFYNEYKFHFENGNINNDILQVEKLKQSLPYNFYGNNDIEINISAIVGKNGSGKSALIELLYVAIYNLALTEGIINKSEQKSYLINEIDIKKQLMSFSDEGIGNFVNSCINKITSIDINEILYYEGEEMSYLNLRNELLRFVEVIEITLNRYLINKDDYNIKDDLKNGFLDCEKIELFFEKSSLYRNRQLLTVDYEIVKNVDALVSILKEYINSINFIEKDIFLEIYFSIGNKIIKISKADENAKEFKYEILNERISSFHDLMDNKEFSMIFYNLVVNYSIYGLNSEETGKWIENIFHKNDGYQTPIVINPFRQKGIIDINSENELVRDRLLANIIINSKLLQVTSNSKIEKLIIKLKNSNDYIVLVEQIYNEQNHLYPNFIKAIINFYNDNKELPVELRFTEDFFTINLLDQYCLNYIFLKLKRIAKNYSIYAKYVISENDQYISSKNISTIVDLLNKISKDKSHITYKIRQSINFIIINKIENKEDLINKYFVNGNKASTPITLNIEEYVEEIKNRNVKYKIDLIDLLPPSIFEIDFVFDNGSKFSALSSGEKQQIFSTNSILYHLINLNSTFGNNFKYKYPYINLILDEIELYAHPQMQRKYINELLEGIKKLTIKNIKGLNLLFITHSPFILSDIPKQNILFLKTEEMEKKIEVQIKKVQISLPQSIKDKNSFGANITDLLADSFFIEDGLIGDFAKDKIEKTIDWLNQILKLKEEVLRLKIDEVKNAKKIKSRLKKIENAKLSELQENIKKTKNKLFMKHNRLINLIDEPLMKYKLIEMYNQAIYDVSKVELLKNKIKEMQNELERISK